MPIALWVLVLLAGGAAAYVVSRKGPKSDSGKPWPGGVTPTTEKQAVEIALGMETDPAKLRAFAAVLDRYDASNAFRLNARAHELDLVLSGRLGPLNPFAPLSPAANR